MMLARLRRSSRLVAALLLTIAVWGVGHKPLTRDLCLPDGPEHHDASRHAFTAAVDLQHEHCAICHWLRFLRPAFTQAGPAVPSLLPGATLSSAPALATRYGAAGILPARAPPTTLL